MIETPTDTQPLRPFDARMINVGDGHWIYVEEVGTREGKPIVFLHGGPGSGAQHGHRALFNHQRDHAFLFDQRGAGRSHPYLTTSDNSTQHLVADIEALRVHFGIEKWLVVGGSWGSTLALAYAQEHPERVAGLVLRAIFLGTKREVHWAFVDGPKTFRPDAFAAFCDWLPANERHDPLAGYIRRLTNTSAPDRTEAAQVWNAYERLLSEINPAASSIPEHFSKDARLPPTPIIEAHYIANDFFLEPGQLLANADRLAGIPGTIIQGRYDLLCPPENACALAAAWQRSNLQILETAGHAMTEPGVIEAMRAAITQLQL